jgi:hypothetical protein
MQCGLLNECSPPCTSVSPVVKAFQGLELASEPFEAPVALKYTSRKEWVKDAGHAKAPLPGLPATARIAR